MKSSLDSIIKILLGIELDSKSGTNEEGTRFSNAFDEANEATIHRFIDIFWKVKRLVNIGREAGIGKNNKVIDQFVYSLINSKIETNHKSEDEVSVSYISFQISTRSVCTFKIFFCWNKHY